MTTLKTLTIVAALLLGGSSLSMAQNGLPTGGYPPVAGGAAGGGWYPGYGYGYRYPAPRVYAGPRVYIVPTPLYGYYAARPAPGTREWDIEYGW
jgi:hypothetical protein